LLGRAEQEVGEPEGGRAIIEMLTTIMAYKFTQLTREEVESMLGITLQETRFYQQAKEEGREQGLQQGLQLGLQQGLQQGLQSEACTLVIRLLTRRLQQQLSSSMRSRLTNLSLPILEDLSLALLDFTTLADLEAWLTAQDLER
jgi:predicted transposase YdaD